MENSNHDRFPDRTGPAGRDSIQDVPRPGFRRRGAVRSPGFHHRANPVERLRAGAKRAAAYPVFDFDDNPVINDINFQGPFARIKWRF